MRKEDEANVVTMRHGSKRFREIDTKVYVWDSAMLRRKKHVMRLTVLVAAPFLPPYAYPAVKMTHTARTAWKVVVTISTRDCMSTVTFINRKRDEVDKFATSKPDPSLKSRFRRRPLLARMIPRVNIKLSGLLRPAQYSRAEVEVWAPFSVYSRNRSFFY